MNSAECYKILGLTEGASHKDVRVARGRLMLQWHPDTVAHNPEFQAIAEEKSKQINMAVDFLMSQPDPASDYARQRDQERAAEQERVERERRKAEDRQRQEEAQRQQQQDAEEARQRRQDAEDRRWQEEERERVLALEEEWQAQWKAEAAQKKAQREAEAAQKAEQTRQREAAKKAKARRPSLLLAACGMIVFIHWCEVELRQANQAPKIIPQQVYSTPQDAAPVDTQANNSQTVKGSSTDTKEARWQEVSENWSESDNGKILIGIPRTQAEGAIGQPTLKFRRPDGLSEEMWFTPNSKGYISIVLQNDEVAQAETVISTPGGDLLPGAKSVHLGEVKKDHPNLQVSAYGYGLSKYAGVDGHDAETAYDEETKHFQGGAITYYYDDIQSGIAFAFGVQDYFDKSIQIEKIIVHVPGIPVFPASNGKSQSPVDEVPDATHPPINSTPANNIQGANEPVHSDKPAAVHNATDYYQQKQRQWAAEVDALNARREQEFTQDLNLRQKRGDYYRQVREGYHWRAQ